MKKLCISLFIIIFTGCISQTEDQLLIEEPLASNQDISEISFFGFQISFCQEEVEQILEKMDLKYEVTKKLYGANLIVPPENQNSSFRFSFFNDEMILMSFDQRDDTLLKYLINELEINPIESVTENGIIFFEWKFEDYEILCWNIKKKEGIYYAISNKAVKEKSLEYLHKKMGNDPFYNW